MSPGVKHRRDFARPASAGSSPGARQAGFQGRVVEIVVEEEVVMETLAGKVALITGTSLGIGSAIIDDRAIVGLSRR